MRIALINENSQAAKNELICATLKKVVEPLGHTVDNYGMYSSDDENQLTYVQNGLLASILLNTGAADYVVTGCGTGEGAMLACNSFPGVLCGHLADPMDGYLFAQINDGNCVAIPFAKDFGWGAELKLELMLHELFAYGSGNGYPKERVVPEQRNKKILDGVKAKTYRPLIDILRDLDPEFVKGTISGAHFDELFYPNCRDAEIAAFLKSLK
ncbi:MAG: RpiB/LacA/LacB family sugar-phosphate isomerase [Oscillospiraceae bacterium]|nr:RpiB/LacA/LacB family sugar-phosphate isomerase [Oscillospiraceae bacterium]